MRTLNYPNYLLKSQMRFNCASHYPELGSASDCSKQILASQKHYPENGRFNVIVLSLLHWKQHVIDMFFKKRSR